MGYGDGEAWGDEAMKKKQFEEQRNARGRGRGNMRGGYQNVGNFRGSRGGGRGGYNNMNNQNNGQRRDLRDKSQVASVNSSSENVLSLLILGERGNIMQT